MKKRRKKKLSQHHNNTSARQRDRFQKSTMKRRQKQQLQHPPGYCSLAQRLVCVLVLGSVATTNHNRSSRDVLPRHQGQRGGVGVVEAFVPVRTTTMTTRTATVTATQQRGQQVNRKIVRAKTSTAMVPKRYNVSVPSQAECEQLGIRDWPQQTKKGTWTEEVPSEYSEALLARYILDGTGTVTITEQQGAEATTSAPISSNTVTFAPGTLVEISTGTPLVELTWQCDMNCKEILFLTPSFEEKNIFLIVAGGIMILFGLLLSGVFG